MSLSRVELNLSTRQAPAARGSQGPQRPPAPEPTPVPGSGPHDPPQAECGDCTPGLHCWQHDTTRNPPTDTPHRDTTPRHRPTLARIRSRSPRQARRPHHHPHTVGRRQRHDMEQHVITIYASIGNSDDKLTQSRWAEYAMGVEGLISNYAEQVHGEWYSDTASPYQNGCFCFEISTEDAPALRERLAKFRAQYEQDSIAWAVAPVTEFI